MWCRIKVSASFGFPFLMMSLLAFSQSLRAQTQPNYTRCQYQGVQDNHQIVYTTSIFRTDLAASDISTAFNRYMSATYDVSKILAGSGYCSTKVSSAADQQAYTMQQLEKQWADSKTTVTKIGWTGTPEEIQAVNAKIAATPPKPAPPPGCRPGDRDPRCHRAPS